MQVRGRHWKVKRPLELQFALADEAPGARSAATTDSPMPQPQSLPQSQSLPTVQTGSLFGSSGTDTN